MSKAEVVVFDLGNVLLEFDYAVAVSRMAAHCSVPSEELLRILNQSPLLHRYESGALTSQAFFEEVKQLSRFCRSYAEFEPLFADIFRPIPEMIECNRWLRSRGIPTVIFSNTNEMAVKHIRATYPFFCEFDHYIFSFEHGAMKPSPSIYSALETRVGKAGHQLLYIDDRKENVHQGAALGWQTIHHLRPEQTIPQVQALLS